MKLQRIGALIKEERIKKGMSQAELANLLQVSVAAVSKWETGKNIPDMSNMERLAQILNIPIHEFLGIRIPAGAEASEAAESESEPAAVAENESVSELVSDVESEAGDASVSPASLRPFKIMPMGVLLVILAGFAITGFIFWQYKLAKQEPEATIVADFYQDSVYGRVYCLVLEYKGELTNDFLQEQAEAFRIEHPEYFNNVQALLLLYYKNYDPSQGLNNSVDFELLVFK